MVSLINWQTFGQITVHDDGSVLWAKADTQTLDNPLGTPVELPNAQVVIGKSGEVLSVSDADGNVLVSLINENDWEPAITYQPGDTVIHQGVRWEAMPDVQKGIAPDDVYDEVRNVGGWKRVSDGPDATAATSHN